MAEYDLKPTQLGVKTFPVQVPDTSETIAKAMELNLQREKIQRQKTKDFQDMIASVINLRERNENIDLDNARAQAALDETKKYHKELLELAGKRPPGVDIVKLNSILNKGISAAQNVSRLLDKNPNLFISEAFQNLRESGSMTGQIAAGALKSIGVVGEDEIALADFNAFMTDPEVRLNTGAALNKDEIRFYNLFRTSWLRGKKQNKEIVKRFITMMQSAQKDLQSGRRKLATVRIGSNGDLEYAGQEEGQSIRNELLINELGK